MSEPTAAEPQRIVSMLASGTELVCALGLGERLVGRSHECDFPEWVRQLPQVSEPTFAIDGSSAEIDRAVRAKLGAGEPLYRVDEAKLLELAPDVLITQTHCEVCAVSPADLVHRLPATLSRKPLVALSGSTLSAVREGFVAVAEVLGRREAGLALVRRLEQQLEEVRALVSGLARPRVACIEWTDPPFAMGNWGPELVAIAGGDNLLGEAGLHSTTISFDAVVTSDPDVLVVAPCGFGLPRAEQEMAALLSRPEVRELRAVRSGRVYVCDGNLYFNRSSPSLFESPRILAEVLHPEAVAPSYEGKAWKRYLSR
ncbi:MAG: cobalamin-binding protein [Myxococcales bacterium]|nr:MAG: cobalamin-binding protein [Myxococcales bacterium]